MSAAHRQDRLRFVSKSLNWTEVQRASILFTGDCGICLNGVDGRITVYGRCGEKYAQSYSELLTVPSFGGCLR